MKMVDPKPQFSHFISELASRHPTLSYIHLIEGRADEGVENVEETLDFAIDAWRPTGQPFFIAGGLTRENALAIMERRGMDNVALVFGRWFLANVNAFVLSKGYCSEFIISPICHNDFRRTFL